MKKLLIAFAIFTAAAASIAAAYAEENIAQVPVPFEWNLELCGELPNGNWACEWDPKIYDNEEFIEKFENGTTTIPDPLEASRVIPEEPEPVPEPVQEPKKKLTNFERDLERFEDRPPATNAEKEYLELLKHLALCQRGYDESRGVQATEEFEISYTWVNDGEAWLRSLDYTGNHARLKMAIEECKAIRTVLNPVTFGPEYLHRSPYFEMNTMHHSQIGDKVPKWSQSRVNEEANANLPLWRTINSLEDLYCGDNAYYSKITKEVYCKPEPIVNVGGGIPVISEALEKRLQYNQDHGASMAEDLRKEKLQEFIREHLK